MYSGRRAKLRPRYYGRKRSFHAGPNPPERLHADGRRDACGKPTSAVPGSGRQPRTGRTTTRPSAQQLPRRQPAVGKCSKIHPARRDRGRRRSDLAGKSQGRGCSSGRSEERYFGRPSVGVIWSSYEAMFDRPRQSATRARLPWCKSRPEASETSAAGSAVPFRAAKVARKGARIERRGKGAGRCTHAEMRTGPRLPGWTGAVFGPQSSVLGRFTPAAVSGRRD